MNDAPPPQSNQHPRYRLPNDGAFVPGAILAERYRIIARVGRGGMGEVYRADDLRLGQPVALKFLPPALEHDDNARERLLAEVRLARTIAHPNVCRVYDIGDLPGENGAPARTFLCMEYIDGEDLGSLLRRIGRLPPAKALDIARQLCAGLSAAHQRGVLHRDLKPANVMIDGRGQARIADFGIAVEATPENDGVADAERSGDNAGTLAYMAPERLSGEAATVQSDLYALGLILYETVTGSAAFRATSLREWQQAHLLSVPSNPSNIVSDVDPAVERAILRCLEKDPAKRPASAAQVAASLPGGDPLAAAIAAGETPSPAMVAASGDDGILTRPKAWGWFAAAVVSLAVAVWSLASVLLINHTPMPLDTAALERRAREITVSLGYVAPPRDWVSEWEHRSKPQRLLFRFRQSPGELFAGVRFGRPLVVPFLYPEDIELRMDARGRLENLDIGGTLDYSDTTGARPVDWTPLLTAIGADTPPVPSSSRRWPSAFLSDTRDAWTAVIDGVPSEIEAAALRGRPVSLRIRKIGAADEHPAPSSRPLPWLVSVLVGFGVGVVVMLGVLARRNLRLGRGDRRGATRLAVFVFVASCLFEVLVRHWAVREFDLLFGFVSSLLVPVFFAVLTWICYVGLEPFARRHWPSLLVSWARLLDGRPRDGIVGQSVLAGVVAGTLGTIVSAGVNVMNRANVGFVYDLRWTWPAVEIDKLADASFQGALIVGMLVIARMVFRRNWAAWSVLVVFMLADASQTGQETGSNSWGALLVLYLGVALMLGTLHRFGLLGLIVMTAVGSALHAAPLTLDPSRWYFWRGAPAVIFVLALAVLGFLNVLGKQSLLPEDAIEG